MTFIAKFSEKRGYDVRDWKSVFALRIMFVLIGGGLCSGQDMKKTFPELSRRTLPAEPPFLWPTDMVQASRGDITKEEILRFLQEMYPESSVETVFAMQSFRFVPLEKDKFWLVAVTDVTGRDFFNSLQIIRCEGRQCIMTGEHSDGENDLDEQLVDVDGDGVFEVVTRAMAGGYDGVFSRPIFVYSIKRLVGGDLVDVSAKYPEYFRDHILPMMTSDARDMKRDLLRDAEPEAVPEASPRLTVAEEADAHRMALRVKSRAAKAKAEMQFVQDDYRRRILGEKAAGLENALRWARDPDPEVRQFATGVLEKIDTPAAAAELERLAGASDATLAQSARGALYRRTGKETYLDPPPSPKKD